LSGSAGLGRFLNLPGANAGGADAEAPGGPIDYRAHGLQVQIPAALADVMSMTDAVTELRTPPAYFANSCHLPDSPESCETIILTGPANGRNVR
jgi:hypothetical protein